MPDQPLPRTPAAEVRPVSVPVFVVSAFAWMAVLIGAWVMANQWTSYPVGVIAGKALEWTAPTWVRETNMIAQGDQEAIAEPGHLEIDTRVEVVVPGSGGRRAEIVLDADPSRYAYGLPIFLALLFAARQRKMIRKALIGYLALLPFQAFTVVFFVLQQIIVATEVNYAQLRVSAWQVEGIIYGFQLGTLVVPTLVPIVVWLWLDRAFFTEVIAKRFMPPRRVVA